MFSKESLYINAIKYDTQLKLDYKKLNNGEIIKTDNSVFLVDDEILSRDIALKLNASQEQTPNAYISTLLISDTTKLVPKEKSSKLKDCELTELNSEYDIAVLKTTLFETKNYFDKTGIDYIYSAFHILNLHLEQNVCKNQLMIFLFNNKAFILLLDDNASIVENKTIDLPTFESIKKTHFYEDDVVGQKLFDEIYYFELNEIIHNSLNEFYEKESKTFIEKVTILYSLKQLTSEQIEQLSDELLLTIDYHPINIDEEIFELSKDIHQKKSFVKPRKKKKNTNYGTSIFIAVFFAILFFGAYKLFNNVVVEEKVEEQKTEKRKYVELPDHILANDKVERRVRAIFETVPYDVILKEIKIDSDSLFLKGTFLKDDTFIKSMEPELTKLYDDIEVKLDDKTKKTFVDGQVTASDVINLKDVTYKENSEKYITDEFLPISRVTEQLKILLPKDSIVKFKSSQNNEVTKFNYFINIIVQTPREFFNIINMLNNELYSINIAYPVNMTKTEQGLEVEFNLVFNQPK